MEVETHTTQRELDLANAQAEKEATAAYGMAGRAMAKGGGLGVARAFYQTNHGQPEAGNNLMGKGVWGGPNEVYQGIEPTAEHFPLGLYQAVTWGAVGGVSQAIVGEMLVGGVAAGRAGAGADSITLYHGSIDNYSAIMAKGLDVARTPTWITTDFAAAQNAIGAGRVLSAGQGVDVGIVQSVVPRAAFQAMQRSGGISALRSWPGFGGSRTFGEFVLRNPDAVRLFNTGIVP